MPAGLQSSSLKKDSCESCQASESPQISGGDGKRIMSDLTSLSMLLYEALGAGKYLQQDDIWQPHHSGVILRYTDRAIGEQRPGVLVLADVIGEDIVQESVESDLPSYVMVGRRLDPGVDLGTARTSRIAAMHEAEHYWAVFVLEGAVLVTLGGPPSSCRLIGEILNLQVPEPFIQRRVCAHCHALNEYHATTCWRCEKLLMATGRLD